MKKILIALMTLLLMSNAALAMQQRAADGIVYWNGDKNYPIWDAGNHGGSCIDLSSAVLKADSSRECLIAVLDYSVNFDTDSMASKGVVQFRENKKVYYLVKSWLVNKWNNVNMTIKTGSVFFA